MNTISTHDLLAHAQKNGVVVTRVGGTVDYRAPVNAITSELLGVLEERKTEVARFLEKHFEVEDGERVFVSAENWWSIAQALAVGKVDAGGMTPEEFLRSIGCTLTPMTLPTEGVEDLGNRVAFEELLALPPFLISGLPLPPTLILSVDGITEPVAFDFRPRSNSWRRQPEPRRPTFDLTEIGALVEAFEQGRAAKRFALWCQQKQREPSWRLTRETALQGASGLIAKPPKPKGWTLDRLLSAIGATLRLIKLDSGGAQTGKRGPYSGVSND